MNAQAEERPDDHRRQLCQDSPRTSEFLAGIEDKCSAYKCGALEIFARYMEQELNALKEKMGPK